MEKKLMDATARFHDAETSFVCDAHLRRGNAEGVGQGRRSGGEAPAGDVG